MALSEEYIVRGSVRYPLNISNFLNFLNFLTYCIHDIDQVDFQYLIDQQNHLFLWDYEKDFPQPHPLEAKGFENTNPRESSPS